MKKIIFFTIGLFLMTGCSKSEIEDVNITDTSSGSKFYAEFETDNTRVYTDNSLKLYWSADDIISVYAGTSSRYIYGFDGNEGDTSGTFSIDQRYQQPQHSYIGNSETTISANYAIYGGGMIRGMNEDETIEIEFPVTQTYAKNSFGIKANTMVAVTKNVKDRHFSFKNVCGFLRIKLYGNNVNAIKEIKLRGNNFERISGRATIIAEYGETPKYRMTEYSSDYIGIDCGDGVVLGTSADDATEFWFVIPPMTFSSGFTITIEDVYGMTIQKTTTKSLTIERNAVSTMATINADLVIGDNPDMFFSGCMDAIHNDIQSYVYSDVSHNYFGQKSFDYLTSLMGNDMVMTGRYGMSLYHYLFDYWQEDYKPTRNRWEEYYRHINRANGMLNVFSDDETSPKVLKYKATALALRGYAYLHLSYLYGLPYYMGADDTIWGKGQQYSNADTPCVPIITETITGDQPRSTVGQVYDLLIADLKEAYDLFVECGMEKTASPTDIDGCFAAMYLARAHMIKHEWSEAAKYAQVVIDNVPILTNKSDILQGFSNINLPDIVYGCDITYDNSGIYHSWFSQMDMFGDGYAAIGVARVAFKPFIDRISNTDIRLDWFWTSRNSRKLKSEFGNVASLSHDYQSCKFIGAGRSNVSNGYGSDWYSGDYIYLRSEEAHFIKAEALAHMGDANAVKVLNDFMVTRDPNYAYTLSSKSALIEEINYQKRIEFWGEGIEYLDNRRLNIPIDRTDATWGADNNHFSGGKMYLTQDAENFVYQIPLSAIEDNPLLSN